MPSKAQLNPWMVNLPPVAEVFDNITGILRTSYYRTVDLTGIPDRDKVQKIG